MTAPIYRDITAERGARAVACVERHLADLTALAAAGGAAYRTVEGSGVGAEVFMADTNTVHTAVRVAVCVRPAARRALETALGRDGFVRCEPSGDSTLLRMASRGGRRAIHVLFGLDDDQTGGAGDGPPDPDDPHGVRRRSRRLRHAWLDLAATYRRVRHETREDHERTESFEVQIIVAPG